MRTDKEYAVSEIWHAALSMIREKLDVVMWNIHQEEYESPFSNTGVRFDGCDQFVVEAFSWDDDEQPFNFKWRDVEIKWYKYLGRGMSANKILTPDEAQEMLIECLDALCQYEKRILPD